MITVSDAILNYLTHCRYEKNLSRLSIKAYEQDLAQFTSFLGKDFVILEISKEILRDYIKQLFAKHFKEATIKRKIASLRVLFRYLEYDDQIQVSPFRKLDIRIKVPERVPRYMSLPEVRLLFLTGTGGSGPGTMFASSPRGEFSRSQRQMILEMLFSTGIRVSELCNLNIDDVDLSKQSIIVYGKGSRERTIQITASDSQATITSFLERRSSLKASTSALLLNNRGKRMQPSSIRSFLRSLSEQARLPFVVRPHMFRHTIATLLIENGIDTRYVQKLLGHSSITTTQIYTHPSAQAEREILSARHPRNLL